jgi:hypothetical protein
MTRNQSRNVLRLSWLTIACLIGTAFIQRTASAACNSQPATEYCGEWIVTTSQVALPAKHLARNDRFQIFETGASTIIFLEALSYSTEKKWGNGRKPLHFVQDGNKTCYAAIIPPRNQHKHVVGNVQVEHDLHQLTFRYEGVNSSTGKRMLSVAFTKVDSPSSPDECLESEPDDDESDPEPRHGGRAHATEN